MNQKIKALAILPLAASLTFFGLQAVTSSVAATTGVGETPATTGATAQTIEDCEWYLNGVADELSLTNTSGMEYVGDDYTLTASDAAVNVYFSGTDVEDVRCSFYDDVRGAGVEVSWTGDSFSNEDPSDISLDWNLGDALEEAGVSSLDVTYVADTCDAAFTSGGAVSISNPDDSPLTPASISDASTGTFTPSAAAPGATWAKCTLNASYSVVLPGSRTPANPGTTYTFTGPGLTTTITVNELIP
jgi:hypothetical protein